MNNQEVFGVSANEMQMYLVAFQVRPRNIEARAAIACTKFSAKSSRRMGCTGLPHVHKMGSRLETSEILMGTL